MMSNFSFVNLILGNNNRKGLGQEAIANFTINSQDAQKGNCFIGLQGNNFDGGDFFISVLKKGVVGLILHKKYELSYLNICSLYPQTWAFFIDDTKAALILLAKEWRKLLDIDIIAITGSVGKTTTKELIKKILENNGYSVSATKKSENGTIGLPLTILNTRENHDIAIFEIGIQKYGEMDILIDILQSATYTIITTILPAHILYFNGIEDIIKEKTKLQSITQEFLCIDYEFKNYIIHKNIVTFGNNQNADFFYNSQDTGININILDGSRKINISVIYNRGFHHCIAAAFSFCYFFKINIKCIIDSIISFKNIAGRFSIHHLKSGGTIINDCSNSAHSSVMLKSIEAFEEFKIEKKKIIVLADMLEQGIFSEEAHDLVIHKINNLKNDMIEKIFYIGPLFKNSAKKNIKNNVTLAEMFTDVSDEIYDYLDKKYCVLFKGSRGMKLFHYISEYIKRDEDL